MKKLSVFILSVLCTIITIAQEKKAGSGEVVGVLLENETALSLPYASVILRNSEGNLVEGVITNEAGIFKLNGIPNGSFTLEVKYIGFKRYMDTVHIDDKNQKIDLGKIILKKDATQLDEITLTGETSRISLRLGKKVFTVGKDVLSQSGSVTDVLDYVPSVNVNPSGVVSLRGNSNVTILINGRRSGLTSSEALQQIPADNVERVEVITNPSAKYDASGSAGIINIILKKNTNKGLSGQVRLLAGIPTDLRIIGNLGYKTKKLNFFLNSGIVYTDFIGFYTKEVMTTHNGISLFLDQRQDQNRHDNGRFFYFGADYYLNERNTITAAFLRKKIKDTDDTNIYYNYFTSNSRDSTLVTSGNSEENRDYNQLEVNYTKTFATEDKKFTFDLQYDFWNSNKHWEILTEKEFPDMALISNLRTESFDKNNDIVVQSDFVTPLGKNSILEMGVKFENRFIKYGFLAEEFSDGDFQAIDGFENELDYDERIIGAYTQYGSKLGKLSYLLGLRFESTAVQIKDMGGNFNQSNSYNRFFPTLNLRYPLSEKTTVQASYSKRIDRPSLWQLNPFPELSDFNSRFSGNPALNPAFTDATEVTLLFNAKNFTLNPSLYYSNTENNIQFYTFQDENSIFVTTMVNLKRETRYGMEVATSYKPFKWLNFNGEFNIYSYEQEGSVGSTNLDFSDETWYAQWAFIVKPLEDLAIQGQIYYQGQKNGAQTRTKAFSSFDFGVSKNILQDKGTIILNVSNIFNTRKLRERIEGKDFLINQVTNFNAARWTLSFIYKFKKEGNQKREAQESNRN